GEEGINLVNGMHGVEAMLVLNDGTQVKSKGFGLLEDAHFGKWPDGFELDIGLQFPPGRERPYVAVWVEDAKGEVVTTLGVWGNDQRWINGLSSWARAMKGNIPAGVTRATRGAGSYGITWDGKDAGGKFVPEGSYKVQVEFSFE